MNDLLGFKRNAVMLGLCEDYTKKWDSAKNKEDLMDMALDSNGVEMLCDAAAFGWGMDIQYMKKTFLDYINGGWKRNRNGYTSCLYVDYAGHIEQECTLTAIISSNVTFHVPKYRICKLHISGNSNVEVTGDGVCYVYLYGDGSVSGKYTLINHSLKSVWTK